MDTTLDRFARRMVGWLWAPPQGMPYSELEYGDWIKPEGRPVKHKTWKQPVEGRGSSEPIPRHIDEFYHRGAYEQHEIRTHSPKKAVLRFRGKGSKIERRHGKRVKK